MYRSLYVQPVMICLQTDMPLAVLTNNVVAVVCNHPWGLTQPGHPCLGEGWHEISASLWGQVHTATWRL